MSTSVQQTWRQLEGETASLAPDSEWNTFFSGPNQLLDPGMPRRNPETIEYPGKGDPSAVPTRTGRLNRKKRFTRTYSEAYFVLTPAGFLHEFASSDPASPDSSTPSFSLFLPACTLSAPSGESAKSHKFHIEGRKGASAADAG